MIVVVILLAVLAYASRPAPVRNLTAGEKVDAWLERVQEAQQTWLEKTAEVDLEAWKNATRKNRPDA